jgi:hypothetical protein
MRQGVGILSTVSGGKTSELDGTSIATRYASGLAAHLLGKDQSIDGLCEYVAKTGLHAIAGKPGGITNALINNGNQ